MHNYHVSIKYICGKTEFSYKQDYDEAFNLPLYAKEYAVDLRDMLERKLPKDITKHLKVVIDEYDEKKNCFKRWLEY